MSTITDMQRILEVATEANVNFGSSNPQMFVKSFFDSLPKDDDIFPSDDLDSISISDNFSQFPSGSEFFTPNRSDKYGEVSCEPQTPTLSLPDSFDNYCDTGFSNQEHLKTLFHVPISSLNSCKRCSTFQHRHVQELLSLETRLKKIITDQNVDHETELRRLRKVHISSEDSHRMEVAGLEDRIQRLSTQLDTEITLRRLSEQRASQYDTAFEESKQTKTQLEELRATVEHQRVALTALRDSEQSARRAAEDSTRLRDLLALDKTFLQQEVRGLEAKVDERVRAAEIASSKALSLDLRVAQLTDQLLTLQLNARSGFDDRMEKEVLRLREDSAREMEAMKTVSRDIVDRENRVLKEAKQALDSECSQLRRRNDALSETASGLRQELSAMSSDKSGEVSELRAELKVKIFELASLCVKYEERMNQMRQLELQLDTSQQELSMHKQALLRLETDSQHQVATLQGEMDRASARLRAYEILEEEVDDAVMRSAAAQEEGDNIAEDETLLPTGLDSIYMTRTQRLVQTLKGIPCNPERRVRQAVFLAQRLMATEKERDLIRTRLGELQNELVRMQEQANVAEENLARSTQPTAYLVSKLRDEERLKLSAMNQVKQLEANLKRRKQSQSAAVGEAQQLRERLFNLLEHRGELETVKTMVRQLCELTASSPRDDHPLHVLYRREEELEEDSDTSEEEEEEVVVPVSPSRSPSGSKNSPVRSVFGLSAQMIHTITSPPPSVAKRTQQEHQPHGSPRRQDGSPTLEFKGQPE